MFILSLFLSFQAMGAMAIGTTQEEGLVAPDGSIIEPKPCGTEANEIYNTCTANQARVKKALAAETGAKNADANAEATKKTDEAVKKCLDSCSPTEARKKLNNCVPAHTQIVEDLVADLRKEINSRKCQGRAASDEPAAETQTVDAATDTNPSSEVAQTPDQLAAQYREALQQCGSAERCVTDVRAEYAGKFRAMNAGKSQETLAMERESALEGCAGSAACESGVNSQYALASKEAPSDGSLDVANTTREIPQEDFQRAIAADSCSRRTNCKMLVGTCKGNLNESACYAALTSCDGDGQCLQRFATCGSNFRCYDDIRAESEHAAYQAERRRLMAQCKAEGGGCGHIMGEFPNKGVASFKTPDCKVVDYIGNYNLFEKCAKEGRLPHGNIITGGQSQEECWNYSTNISYCVLRTSTGQRAHYKVGSAYYDNFASAQAAANGSSISGLCRIKPEHAMCVSSVPTPVQPVPRMETSTYTLLCSSSHIPGFESCRARPKGRGAPAFSGYCNNVGTCYENVADIYANKPSVYNYKPVQTAQQPSVILPENVPIPLQMPEELRRQRVMYSFNQELQACNGNPNCETRVEQKIQRYVAQNPPPAGGGTSNGGSFNGGTSNGGTSNGGTSGGGSTTSSPSNQLVQTSQVQQAQQQPQQQQQQQQAGGGSGSPSIASSNNGSSSTPNFVPQSSSKSSTSAKEHTIGPSLADTTGLKRTPGSVSGSLEGGSGALAAPVVAHNSPSGQGRQISSVTPTSQGSGGGALPASNIQLAAATVESDKLKAASLLPSQGSGFYSGGGSAAGAAGGAGSLASAKALAKSKARKSKRSGTVNSGSCAPGDFCFFNKVQRGLASMMGKRNGRMNLGEGGPSGFRSGAQPIFEDMRLFGLSVDQQGDLRISSRFVDAPGAVAEINPDK